jgi:hypothetical protein
MMPLLFVLLLIDWPAVRLAAGCLRARGPPKGTSGAIFQKYYLPRPVEKPLTNAETDNGGKQVMRRAGSEVRRNMRAVLGELVRVLATPAEARRLASSARGDTGEHPGAQSMPRRSAAGPA